MTYSEKLKDPRWQKKRLKILERDNFTCTKCGNDKITLHIHHAKYLGLPWEVEDKYLSTICETCHKNEHFKPVKLSTIVEPKYIEQPVILFESQLIDSDNFQGIRTYFLTLLNYQDTSTDIEFIILAKNDLSLICFESKIILVCVNGDVYGEKEIVIRHV